MMNALNRRQLLRGIGSGSVISRFLSAAADSPAGTITVQGRVATFSVDYGRPLESVVYTFIQEYGWTITFEEAPIMYSRDMVDVTRDFSLGIRVFDPRGGRLEFSFDLGPGGQPPQNPRLPVEAAIQAHHSAGFPGRYTVIDAQPYLHIVPVARADEGGVFEAIRSPLDEIVTIEAAARSPRQLLKELVQSLEQSSGYRVVVAGRPFSEGIQPEVHNGFTRTQARAVLRALISATGKRRVWYMLYHIRTKRYFLNIS